MAEVLHDFGLIRTAEDEVYHVKACGSPLDDTVWQGWLEFESVNRGETVRSPRETTQPNRADTVYWATGLTLVYLEGALQRALRPLTRVEPIDLGSPAFDGPAPTVAASAPAPGSVLNPFSVYRKGEQLLRDQLHALSAWHLVNIINAHRLSVLPQEDLALMSSAELTELIVAAVRASSHEPVA